jgi:hypothetical protein
MALFAFGLMLQLKFNHLQITYYTVLIVLIYGIGEIISTYKNKAYLHFGIVALMLFIGLILAVGANLSRFMSVLEYSPYSTRGPSNLDTVEGAQGGLDKDYAFNWSQGKLETLTLLVPYIYGGGSTEKLPEDSNSEKALRANGVDTNQSRDFLNNARTYWGDQPGTGGPIYGGAIMLFAFVLGILFVPRKQKVVFLTITLLSILLAWGKNLEWFNYTVFDFLPGYNKFRAVTMGLSMALFAIPVLGALGLEHLFKLNNKAQIMKGFWIALGSTAGISAFLWLFAGMFSFRAPIDSNFPNWLAEALMEDRKVMLKSSALKSLIFISLAAAAVWAALKDKISTELVGTVIAILLIIDLWNINSRYLNEESFQSSPSEQFFSKSPADDKILRDKDYYRVLNLDNPFNEARTSYYHNSIGGYHGAKMKRYQEMIENVLSPEMQVFIQKAQEGEFDWKSLKALNMLNTKYIIAGRGENAVFQNPEVNGVAWFPESVQSVASNEEELEQIPLLDTKTIATVNESEFGKQRTGSGEVSLSNRIPNELTYTVEAEKGGLVVFSEIYYPNGWKASVNGEEVPIIRTNYLLRGVQVPEGKSVVNMKFEPSSYYKTKNIVVILQYLISLLLIGAIALAFNKHKKNF